jgi:tetratricopeptide (TPR) repeat protein
MKRLTALLVVLSLVALSVSASAAEGDLAARIKEDVKGRKIFDHLTQTPEAKRPVITADGPVSPATGTPLRVIFLKVNRKKPTALKIAAFHSPTEKKYWIYVWGSSRNLQIITGPYELRRVTLGMVRRAIKKLITQDGSYGFYDGQFKELEKMGKGAIPWLLELFRDESNDMPVRVLALEALGDLRDTSVRPKLRELIHNENYSDFQRPIAFTLAKLGDQTFSDIIIERFKNFVRGNEGNPRAQAAGYSGLAHAYSRLKRQEKAVECYKMVIKLDPEARAGAYYNLACSYAKMKKIKEAVDAVAKAADEGYDDWRWMLKDGDLDPIKENPRFKAIIEELKKKQK